MAFPTTNWTLLAQASLNGDEAGRRALDALCTAYRRPVVAYLRSRGLAQEDAEDAAHDFLLKLVRSSLWKRADRLRGKFRTFLLAILSRLMLQQFRNQQREKRGGGMQAASLDDLATDDRSLAVEDPLPGGESFDREWAFTLVSEAVSVVEQEFSARGQDAQFALLRRYLPGSGDPPPYEIAAAELSLSPPALKAAIHRLRQRFREVLRTLVARTVAAPHEVDDELRYLGTLLASGTSAADAARNSGQQTG